MNITRNNVDALNAIITIDVAKEDFADKVENVLKIIERTQTYQDLEKDKCLLH